MTASNLVTVIARSAAWRLSNRVKLYFHKTLRHSRQQGIPCGTTLADSPWDVNQRGNYGAIHRYSLMSLERIKAMPIAELAEDNARCWLWVTNGALRHGFEVLEVWEYGFLY